MRLVLDADTGVTMQRIDYDEFGQVLQDTNPGFQPFGFAGGLYDQDTGLVLFGSREYDPAIGRWTGRDPSGFANGEANLYTYCFNDPIKLPDPTGADALGRGPIRATPPKEPNRPADYYVYGSSLGWASGGYIKDSYGRLYGVIGVNKTWGRIVLGGAGRGYIQNLGAGARARNSSKSACALFLLESRTPTPLERAFLLPRPFRTTPRLVIMRGNMGFRWGVEWVLRGAVPKKSTSNLPAIAI